MKATDRNKVCFFCKKIFYNPYGMGIGRWKKQTYCSKHCAVSVNSMGRNLREKNYKWKGETVGYSGLHRWVRYWLGKAIECVNCGTQDARIGWASMSHKAKRDLNDYMPLCTLCHKRYDLGRG